MLLQIFCLINLILICILGYLTSQLQKIICFYNFTKYFGCQAQTFIGLYITLNKYEIVRKVIFLSIQEFSIN